MKKIGDIKGISVFFDEQTRGFELVSNSNCMQIDKEMASTLSAVLFRYGNATSEILAIQPDFLISLGKFGVWEPVVN